MRTNSSSTVARSRANRALVLFTERRKKFLNFVHAAVYDPDEAEDVLQRASLKVISRAVSLRDPDRAEAWIYRLLRNEIADHFRRHAVESRRRAELPQDISSPALATVDSHRRRLCPCAIEELKSLHPSYADALRAIEMDGETIVAYAARLGISANSATVRLHRARKSLRSRLQARCGSCSGAGCFDCDCRHGSDDQHHH